MSNMLTKEQKTKALANNKDAQALAALLIIEMADVNFQARQLKWWQFTRKRLYSSWSKIYMRKAEYIVQSLTPFDKIENAARP